MSSLVEQQYFDKVIAAMKEKGLVLFSQVAIAHPEGWYHVPATVARDTRLFFHYPNKNLIVRLGFHESDAMDTGNMRRYWSIGIDIEFLPTKEMVEKTWISPEDEDWSIDPDESCRKVPLYDTMPPQSKFPNFRVSSGRCQFEQQVIGDWGMSPETLQKNVWGLIGETIPYLRQAPFSELQVTDFPPHYAFRGSAPLFWDKFNRRYLRSLVRRPWGSEGLKR